MELFYIYKITLLRGSHAGKYYLGQRKWRVPKKYWKIDIKTALCINPMLDTYSGSSTRLKLYFKTHTKYPGVTFVKEILGFYDDANTLNEAEREIIGNLWKDDIMCLNLMPGGENPPTFKGHKKTGESKRKISDAIKQLWKKPGHKEHMRELMSGQGSNFYGKEPWNKGKKGIQKAWNRGVHMDENFCNKMKEANSGNAFVYKDGQTKRIKLNELEEYLKNGWIRGKYGKGHWIEINGKKRYVLN